MKFIHAADVHLDSPLRGLEQYEGAPTEEIRGATRKAFEQLIDFCLEEEVDLLLLAGDLYDADWKDYNTGLFFIHQVARLTRSGIRVVIVRGNHDAASQITRRLRLPDGVYELPTRKPDTLCFEDLEVAIHGQGFAKREVSSNLARSLPDPLPGRFNIGLLHSALDGREGHDVYAPCSLSDLTNKGYDYWALGHIHRREVVSRDPPVIFPGNLQGRHSKETGPKGAYLVEVEEGELLRLDFKPLESVRWELLEVDVSDSESFQDIAEASLAALQSRCGDLGDQILAARLSLHGACPMHHRLLADPERLAQEVRAAASELAEPVWVEKVLARTRPEKDRSALASREDAVGELLRGLARLPEDEETLRAVKQAVSGLARKLPSEYKQHEEGFILEDTDSLLSLLPEVEDLLVALLQDWGEAS
jgi:DNA repair exonuclease SbcCD nuclease subunit